MKKWLFIFAVFAGMTSARLAAQTNLLARIHFIGSEKIFADSNSLAFTNLFCSAEARALENQTLDKLARAPYRFLQKRTPSGLTDEAALLRPLLDDLTQAEWFLEARDATNGSPEFALAVRLDDNRAELWSKNLSAVLEAWTKISVEKIRDGWQVKKHEPPNLFRFVRANDWVVIGLEQGALPLSDDWIRLARKGKNFTRGDEDNWLSLNLNLSRLSRWIPFADQPNLPEMRLQVFPKSGDLHGYGKFIFPQPLDLRQEPWKIPTNVLHEPFVSLTALRGFQSFLQRQNCLSDYRQLLPNQMFVWALDGIPFQTYVAAPYENATNVIVELNRKLTNQFESELNLGSIGGSIQLATNHAEINWHGLPFVTPFVQAESEAAGQFLFAGAFPNSPEGEPLPPQLFAALNQTNLVFYHWEITAQRFPQVLNLSQLALMLSNRPQLDGKSLAAKWLFQITPKLGNNVTTVTQSSSHELTLTRRAPAGLTAAELIALAHWLEATNFPLGTFQLPPLPKK
ncbi:MAG TPA: hypothetical protein VHG71_11495 [Verrucomicrobiae bacterium]|nr:hypothetical protein [Verrucomicrobiae bacterium]